MNYPFANGRIAAIDNHILDRTKLAKLAKTPKKDFQATLVELGYTDSSSGTLEDVINREINNTKALLDEISPQKEFTDLFFLENDAINIKALYKMKIYGLDNDTFKSSGIFSRKFLEDVILHGYMEGLSKELKKFFESINAKIIDTTNPRLISAIIDNCLFGYLLGMLRKKPNPILKTYFQAKIDMTNVLTLIRGKKLNWNQDQISEMFINGGNINISQLTKASLKTDFSNSFGEVYNGKVNSGLKKYKETSRIDQLEMYFDELLLELMKVHEYDAYSIGPIIYYFLKKQAEAKNIRLIYANDGLELNNLLQY